MNLNGFHYLRSVTSKQTIYLTILKEAISYKFRIIFIAITVSLAYNSVAQIQPPEVKKTTPLTRILFIFDASQSMLGRWQSDTKFNIKIQNLPYGFTVTNTSIRLRFAATLSLKWLLHLETPEKSRAASGLLHPGELLPWPFRSNNQLKIFPLVLTVEI